MWTETMTFDVDKTTKNYSKIFGFYKVLAEYYGEGASHIKIFLGAIYHKQLIKGGYIPNNLENQV